MSGIILFPAAGGYYYCANQFEKQAEIVVRQIDELQPNIKFDAVEIDKFRFNVRFKNLKISTVDPSQAGPYSMLVNGTILMHYQPFTKKLDVSFIDKEIPIRIDSGKEDYALVCKNEKPSVFSITFDHHPFITDKEELKESFYGIRNVHYQTNLGELLNVKTGQKLLQFEPGYFDLSLKVPSDDKDPIEVKFNSDLDQKKADPAFNEFVDQFFGQTMNGLLAQNTIKELEFQLKSLFSYDYHNVFSGIFHVEKQLVQLLINGDKMAILSQGIPKVFLDTENNTKADWGDTSSKFKIDTTEKDIEGSIDVSGDLNDKFQDYLKSILKHVQEQDDLTSDFMPDWTALVPNMEKLGKFDLKIKVDYKTEAKKIELSGDFISKPYKITTGVKYDFMEGGVLTVRLYDPEIIFADFKSYLESLRIPFNLNSEQMNGVDLYLAQIQSMGKKETEDGNDVLVVDMPLPSAMGVIASQLQ